MNIASRFRKSNGCQEDTIGSRCGKPNQSLLAANKADSATIDLFGFADRYPNGPGFKSDGTSRAAAAKIAIHAKTVRADVLAEYAVTGDRGMTADQCAKAISHSVLSVRPRVTELARAGFLVPVDERRKNESGMTASVLRISRAGLEASASRGAP